MGGIYRLREREGVTWGVGQKRARGLGSGSGGNWCVCMTISMTNSLIVIDYTRLLPFLGRFFSPSCCASCPFCRELLLVFDKMSEM